MNKLQTLIKEKNVTEKQISFFSNDSYLLDFLLTSDDKEIKMLKELEPIYPVLRLFSLKKLKKLMNNSRHISREFVFIISPNINDSFIKWFRKLKNKKRFNSIDEIVDYLFQITRYEESSLEPSNNYYPLIKKLDNKLIKGIHFSIPKTNIELIEIGKRYNSCIGSYSGRILSGQELKVISFKEGKPFYNIGFCPKKKNIVQIKGQSNLLPTKEERDFILEVMATIGIYDNKKVSIREEITSYNVLAQ
jgi:hypothetical protein